MKIFVEKLYPELEMVVRFGFGLAPYRKRLFLEKNEEERKKYWNEQMGKERVGILEKSS
jgi:hypothetical protein